MWLPECLHWPFCPGFFIAILAFVAAAVALRKEPGQREKAIWVLLFLGLMCAEIWMMGIDRKTNIAKEKETRDAEIASFKAVGDGIKDSIRNSQAQFAATIGRFDEQSALLKAINEAGQRVAEVLKSTVHSQRDEVQIEGVQLSQKILQFLYDRDRATPVRPIVAPGQDVSNQYDSMLFAYRNETVKIYRTTFGPSVSVFLKDLARQGVDDSGLVQSARSPEAPYMIRIVAEKIGEVAMKLGKD